MTTQQRFQHAAALHGQGQLDAAQREYRAVLALDPDHADAVHYLGVIALQQNNIGEAVRQIGRARELKPDDPAILSNLAFAQQQAGALEQAIELLTQAVQIAPDNASSQANLANMMMQAGRASDALTHYRIALKLDPGLTDARRNLALALAGLHHFAEALQQIRQAAAQAPASIEVQFALAHILTSAGFADEAREILATLYAHNRQQPQLVHNYSIALAESGRPDDALAMAREAARLAPGFVDAQLNLAALLQETGAFDEANDVVMRVLQQAPHHARALSLLVRSKQDSVEPGALIAQLHAAAAAAVPLKDKISLNHALGDAYHRQQQIEAAFEHYAAANELARRQRDYDVQQDVEALANIAARFTAAEAAKRDYAGYADVQPVFIVGMPRSGSSLAEQILAAHPDVMDAGEVPLLSRAIGTRCAFRNGLDWSDSFQQLAAEDYAHMAQDYAASIAPYQAKAKRVTDKMLFNFVHIGLIKRLFPHAKIVHCVRDPLNTCWSIYKHNFSNHGHYYAHDQAQLGTFYRAYQSLMRHWTSLYGDTIFDLHYEALLDDQAGVTNALLDYCELPRSEACLRFHEHRRRVATLSVAQVRQPLYGSARDAAQAYASFLGPLQAALGNTD